MAIMMTAARNTILVVRNMAEVGKNMVWAARGLRGRRLDTAQAERSTEAARSNMAEVGRVMKARDAPNMEKNNPVDIETMNLLRMLSLQDSMAVPAMEVVLEDTLKTKAEVRAAAKNPIPKTKTRHLARKD